jgi:hypothetical protein
MTDIKVHLKPNLIQFQPKSQPMKKFLYTIVLAMITSVAVSSCTEQEIKPKAGGDTTLGSTDPCQFGGPGCPGK